MSLYSSGSIYLLDKISFGCTNCNNYVYYALQMWFCLRLTRDGDPASVWVTCLVLGRDNKSQIQAMLEISDKKTQEIIDKMRDSRRSSTFLKGNGQITIKQVCVR